LGMPQKKGLSKSFSQTLRPVDDMDRIVTSEQKFKIVSVVKRRGCLRAGKVPRSDPAIRVCASVESCGAEVPINYPDVRKVPSKYAN
jgi:hypothetical protein